MAGARPQTLYRVLVIDDDEVIRELLSVLLAVQGHQVRSAISGDEAFDLLRSGETPDVILTDMQMPGTEGAALITGLREAVPASTRIVGMSGRQPSATTLALLDHFVPKPFDSAKLEAAFAAASAGQRPPLTPSETASDPSSFEALPEASLADFPPLDEAIFTSMAKLFQSRQLRELYDMTLADVEVRHARVVAHAGAGEIAEAKREAHAIKGGCGMVGARELQHLATLVEGGSTLDTSAIADFPSACTRLRRMLDEKLQQKW